MQHFVLTPANACPYCQEGQKGRCESKIWTVPRPTAHWSGHKGITHQLVTNEAIVSYIPTSSMPSPALSPTHCQRPDQVSPETRPRTTYNPPTSRPRPDNALPTTEPCAVSAPTTPHQQPDRDLPAARPRPAHHPSAPRSRPRRRLVDAQTTPYSRPACAPPTTLPASCSLRSFPGRH